MRWRVVSGPSDGRHTRRMLEARDPNYPRDEMYT